MSAAARRKGREGGREGREGDTVCLVLVQRLQGARKQQMARMPGNRGGAAISTLRGTDISWC